MTGLSWPREWGPNTPAERRAFFARIYRDAALSDDPRTAVETADRVARAYGELWLFPQIDTGDEWITLRQFAVMAGLSVKRVYNWYGAHPPSWATPPVRVAGKVRRIDATEFLDARDVADDQQDAA